MAISTHYYLFSACIVLLYLTATVSGGGAKLITDIFAGYSRHDVPVKARNDTMTVEFDVSLIRILEVNEKENSITLMLWLTMIFNDYRLKWNPEEYDGINKLTLPFGDLWMPDIVLYYGLSGTKVTSDEVSAVIRNDGTILAVTPMQSTVTCQMDLAMFPYDRQSCSLKFASWTTSASELDLQIREGTGEIQMSGYIPNSDWDLVNTSLVRNEVTMCCPKDQYVDITAYLKISRRDGPYTVKLVIPSVLTALLVLFTFLLPSSSGEIILFCLLLFHAVLILHAHLDSAMPNHSESVLGEFLTFALFLDFFATIIAVIFHVIAECLHQHHLSKEQRHIRDRKLRFLRCAEYGFFVLYTLIFVIGTAVILTRG